MCNCLILWLISLFLSFFYLYFRRLMFIPVPWRAARSIHHQEILSLCTSTSGGNYPCQYFFRFVRSGWRSWRQHDPPWENQKLNILITENRSPSPFVWLLWRRAPPGVGNGQGGALTQPAFQRQGCLEPTSPLPGRGLCFGWLRGPSTPGCRTESRSWSE